MSEREMIRVKLHPEGYDAEVNTTLPDAIEWLTELLENVPEEHRALAAFVVEKESGSYDESDTLIFDIYYDRPETDAEMAKRLADDAARTKHYKRQREAHEKAEFERLKAKFG